MELMFAIITVCGLVCVVGFNLGFFAVPCLCGAVCIFVGAWCVFDLVEMFIKQEI